MYHMYQNMLGSVAKILALLIFQNFDPGEKSKLKIPGEKVFNEAESKLHQREKIYIELNRSARLLRHYLSYFRVYEK